MADNLEERTYYLQTVSMYMGLTKETVIKVFKFLIKNDNITEFLSSIETGHKLKDLVKNDILKKTEYDLVRSSYPNPDKFDISLLFRLVFGLCGDVIPKPKSGWSSKLQPKDESLGADLIRLRDVRNKLIGHHRKDAKLSEAEYGKIWNKVEAILERLAEKVDPESKESIKSRLDDYKRLFVDTENVAVKRLLEQLLQYENEVEQLQDKVEELSKISQGLKVFFEKKPERYTCYIKLLFQGGPLVLRGVLERELAKHGKNLVTLLFENKTILETKVDSKYQSFLFPPEQCNLDHKKWDIDLLASVILLVFTDISANEIERVKQIRNAGLNYAEHALESLDMDKFLPIWTKLVCSLQYLSMNIDEEKKLNTESLINRYMETDKGDTVDADEYLDELKKSGVPLKTIEDMHNETVYRLGHELKQLKELGVKFKKEHDFELKIVTTCKNEEKKKHAEDTLERHLKASFHKSDLPTNFIRMEADNLFASVTAHPDVKPTGVKRGCIIVSFKSSSPDGLLHLLTYFSSQTFQTILDNISNELCYLYGDAFLVQGHVTLESLSRVLQNLERSNREKTEQGLILPLKCSSVEGIEHVLSVLKSEETTKSINRIAEKISDKLEESIKLSVVPDLLEFEDAFSRTEDADKTEFDGTSKDEKWARCSPKKEDRSQGIDTDSDSYLNDYITVVSNNDPEVDTFVHSLPPGSKDDPISRSEISNQSRIEHAPSQFSVDPYLSALYLNAILRRQERDSTIRVNIVGNFAQGKSSLTRRLLRQSIGSVLATNSIEINHAKYKRINDKLIFYTKGAERDEREVDPFESKNTQLEEENDFNHQAKISSEAVTNPEWVCQVLSPSRSTDVGSSRRTELSSNVAAKEASTRRLLEKRFSRISYTEMEKQNDIENPFLSEKEIMQFSSHLDNGNNCRNSTENLEIWDFGGRFTYYATHALFHSRRAVYLLVFDLSTSLDETVRDSDYPEETEKRHGEEFVKFWINSIHSYVGSVDGSRPPVILVGTHKDKLKGHESAKQRFRDKYFEEVRKLFADTVMINHIHPTDFAVDNTDPHDTSIDDLREEIIRVGNCVSINERPMRWLQLEMALKKKRSEKIITFEDVIRADSANKFPLQEMAELKLFLNYHHEMGTLFYFDEEPVSKYIVLDNQYLIDAFNCILTSERSLEEDPSFRLRRHARVENELIEKLWSMETDNAFLKHKHILLMFLKKHHIISEALEFDEHFKIKHGLGWFVVPSLLRDKCSEDTLKEFIIGKQQTSVRFVMAFSNSLLAQTVYHKVLAAATGKWPVVDMTSSDRRSLLYVNLGVFILDDFHAGIVEIKHNHIDLRVLYLCHSSYDETAEKFRCFSESIVKNEFRKMWQSTDSVQQKHLYTSCFRCNNEKHGLNGSINTVSIKSIQGIGLMPCPDMTDHTICIEQAMSEWFQTHEGAELLTPDFLIKEKQLRKIAQSIGHNWELLGIELGLSHAQIQQLISTYSLTSKLKIYMMLKKWKDNEGEGATVVALIQAMKAVKTVDIEWDKVRDIVEEINYKH